MTTTTTTTTTRLIIVAASFLCWGTTQVSAFGTLGLGTRPPNGCLGSSTSDNDHPGPSFPSSFAWHSSSSSPSSDSGAEAETKADGEEEEPTGQANTRFSAFAPDPNLDASDFRLQLRENMKADLERRRNEDPNRGNQIAKNYLDSL